MGGMTVKAVIVDDEYYAIQGLKMELEEIGGVEIIGMYEDAIMLLKALGDIQADILFLDIEMPQVDGFALAEKVFASGRIPHIVFVTAYNHYAVKAFEINAIDYIVKPVTKNRLIKTIERIKLAPRPTSEPSLHINCFRHFSVQVNGKDLNSGWRTRKAEELIAFLICEKGNYVAKEKIAEALWPEQSRDSALSNLYMAYYYIKKQEEKTGVKIPIESERGKMRIDMKHIVCDMVEFAQLIDNGKKSNGLERIAYYEKAGEIYQGTLFEDRYYTWTSMIQGFYEFKYIELITSLIECYKSDGNKQKVVYYQKKLNGN